MFQTMGAPQPYLPFSYLEWNAAERGSAPAIWDGGTEITFSELRARVLQGAATMAGMGVGEGSVVGVQLPNVWEYVALELAIAYLGAVIVPLPLALGDHERKFILERTGATPVICTDAAGSAAGLAGATTVAVEDIFSTRVSGSAPLPAAADPARVAEVALTSGSTGMPKLASLTAELKQVTFESFTSRLAVGPGDRVLGMSPLTQGIGGMCLYCLRAGAALVMLRDPRWTPEHTVDVARSARPTVLVGVPTNLIRILNMPGFEPKDVATARVTAAAGAPMPPDVAERWETLTGSRVCIFYGSMDAGQLAVASPSDPQVKRWTTVGRPHERAEWTIVDSGGRPLPHGEAGEICMRGPLVQPGYWGEDRSPYAHDGWAHMGDLGLFDADGFLHVVGRVKDIVIRGGANINPYEVESILREHPLVLEVCVVGRPHPELGEVAVAFVVARELPGPSLDDIHAYLRDRGLARYKWPDEVRVLFELPLRGPGKVDRRTLNEVAAQPPEGGPNAISVR